MGGSITDFDDQHEIYLLDEWVSRGHMKRHRQLSVAVHLAAASPAAL
jgi:quinol monooxygenase YgiN